MDILIAYESALEYWRTAGPGYLQGYQARRNATRRACRSLAAGERPCLVGGDRRPAGCSLPVCALVARPEDRSRSAKVNSTVWSDFAEASFVDAGEGFLISTPEFCFLQMASRLSLNCLILLAFEFCGTFSLAGDGPAVSRDSSLTTVAKLAAFVESMPNVRGHKKAQRALRYAMDGSASPMEAVSAMLLCLPYALGGYGLKNPQLNYHIDIPEGSRKLADRSYCECDLCWPEFNLAVEYDSDLHHTESSRRESDATRRNTLLSLGFAVVTVSSGQVLSGGRFNRLAHQLAKQMGKRLRYVDPGFTRTHLALRKELFGAIGITSFGY